MSHSNFKIYENDILSLSSNGRVSLFFKSRRGLNVPQHYQYMIQADRENPIETFLLSFHIRDCRGGKGERDIGRRCFIWLFINRPRIFIKIINLIPMYGRWDDLLQFFPGVLDISNINYVRSNFYSNVPNQKRLIVLQTIQQHIVKIFAQQLREDHNNMIMGKPCSLAAKWAPTEGDSLDKISDVFKTLATEMKISPRSLRKEYLTPLRAYIKVVERFMCDQKWSEIDYSKVPSKAMKRLKKSFENHDKMRFQIWKNNFKVDNTNHFYPHELIREIRIKNRATILCSQKWTIFEEEILKLGVFDDCIAVVDTSPSMYSNDYLPFDISICLGLLISKANNGPFKNHIINFKEFPSFILLDSDECIYNRWYKISKINWGGTINIQSVFELILQRGRLFKINQKDMPKRVFIISDMQFDKINDFKYIEQKYETSLYKCPQIVFWNVNGSTTDFSIDNNGTIIISGFSPEIFNIIVRNKNISPYNIVQNTLYSERLKPVRISLGIEK